MFTASNLPRHDTLVPLVLTVLATAGLVDGGGHGDCGDGRG